MSFLLHTPFTPVIALLGLVGLLVPHDAQDDIDLPPITTIPIDLTTEEAEEPAPAVPASGPADPNAPAMERPKPDPAADLDAGVADGGDAEPDAGELEDAGGDAGPEELEDAGEPQDAGGLTAEDAGVAAAAPEDAGEAAELDAGERVAQADAGQGAGFGDPVALSGAAGKIADPGAAIKIILHTDRIRRHPQAKQVGKMLGQAYQWRDFFGPSGLDPIQDFDRILIAGPQLADSSEVVAVLRYNVSRERIRGAIDAIVQRDSAGEWLDAGVPAARAWADRAKRTFVMPAANLVMVVPPSAEQHALLYGRKTRFPKTSGSETMTATIQHPSQTLRILPVRFPPSIQALHLKLEPNATGGGVAHVLADDESPEQAEQNARALEQGITAISRLNLGLFGAFFGKRETRFIETVQFEAKGSRIEGQLVVTAQQLNTILELAAQFMTGGVRRRPPELGAPEPPPVQGSPAPPAAPSEPEPPRPPDPPSP